MSKPSAETSTAEPRFGLIKEMWKVLKQDKTALSGFMVILAIVAVAVLAPVISPYGYSEQHILDSFKDPGPEYFLGTDEFGRDLLTRIIWGARPALLVGVLSVLVSIGIGVPIGLMAGYKMGYVDRIVSWWVDVALSFPSILLGLMIVILLGPGLLNVSLAIGISHVPQYVRLSRGPTMALRGLDFVSASKALGATDLRIAFGHVLPNIIGPIIIMGTLSIAGAIRMEASLSFLGFGVTPPDPSWGNLIREGVDNILQSPWVALFPGLALTFSVLAFNMVGDSLRDMFDPRAILTKKKG